MDSTKKPTTPLRSALRQARYVVLGALSIAVVYNVFATTGVPWIAEPPKSAGGMATRGDLLPDSSKGAIAQNLPQTVDTNKPQIVPPPIDTVSGTAVDMKRVKDSLEAVRKAKAEDDKRRLDSIRAARKAPVKQDTAARTTQATPPSTDDAGSGKPKDIDDINVVREVLDRKAALFVDARKAEDFAKGHIPGAINIYGEDGFQSYIPMLMKYPRSTRVIVYCGGGLCTLSHETADNIATMQWFSKIFVFTGGTKAWLDAKYPFTKPGE